MDSFSNRKLVHLPDADKEGQKAQGGEEKRMMMKKKKGRKNKEKKKRGKKKKKEKENRSPKGNMWSAIPVALL